MHDNDVKFAVFRPPRGVYTKKGLKRALFVVVVGVYPPFYS